MTTKTITDRAGDILRLSTGSLTAGPGEITVKVTERFRGREAVAAVHVDPAALRAALDEVVPAGSYTRTDDDGLTLLMVQQQRDQATARAEKAEHDLTDARGDCNDALRREKSEQDRAEKAEKDLAYYQAYSTEQEEDIARVMEERDRWRAGSDGWAERAEKAEQERDEAVEALDTTLGRAIKAERERDEMLTERDAWEERLTSLVYSLATVEEVGEWSSGNELDQALIDHMQGKIQRLERSADQPRPLPPDDVRRALDAAVESFASSCPPDDEPYNAWKVRQATWEALRELFPNIPQSSPARPEGAEDIEAAFETWERSEYLAGGLDGDDKRLLADHIAASVRVVTEEQP